MCLRTEERADAEKVSDATIGGEPVIAVGCAQSDPGVTTAVKSKLAVDETVKAYQGGG